jgi:hypothetical protein
MSNKVRDLFDESSFIYKEPTNSTDEKTMIKDAWSIDISKDFYIYDGFGFPVVLCNPILIETRGEYTPDIDYNKLMDEMYAYLSNEKDLTKEHREFMRKYEGMKR